MSLRKELLAHWPEPLSEVQIQKLEDYWGLISSEPQNLTAISQPGEFVFKMLLDVWHLLNSGWLTYPVADFGSGQGVPGLVCGIFEPEKEIVLIESEWRKADFLTRACERLGLNHVRVCRVRGEEYFQKNTTSTIVSKAVASVEKFDRWLGDCSTWNNLILIKGPGWNQERADYMAREKKTRLRILEERAYLGTRVLVKIVPRGTK